MVLLTQANEFGYVLHVTDLRDINGGKVVLSENHGAKITVEAVVGADPPMVQILGAWDQALDAGAGGFTISLTAPLENTGPETNVNSARSSVQHSNATTPSMVLFGSNDPEVLEGKKVRIGVEVFDENELTVCTEVIEYEIGKGNELCELKIESQVWSRSGVGEGTPYNIGDMVNGKELKDGDQVVSLELCLSQGNDKYALMYTYPANSETGAPKVDNVGDACILRGAIVRAGEQIGEGADGVKQTHRLYAKDHLAVSVRAVGEGKDECAGQYIALFQDVIQKIGEDRVSLLSPNVKCEVRCSTSSRCKNGTIIGEGEGKLLSHAGKNTMASWTPRHTMVNNSCPMKPTPVSFQGGNLGGGLGKTQPGDKGGKLSTNVCTVDKNGNRCLSKKEKYDMGAGIADPDGTEYWVNKEGTTLTTDDTKACVAVKVHWTAGGDQDSLSIKRHEYTNGAQTEKESLYLRVGMLDKDGKFIKGAQADYALGEDGEDALELGGAGAAGFTKIGYVKKGWVHPSNGERNSSIQEDDFGALSVGCAVVKKSPKTGSLDYGEAGTVVGDLVECEGEILVSKMKNPYPQTSIELKLNPEVKLASGSHIFNVGVKDFKADRTYSVYRSGAQNVGNGDLRGLVTGGSADGNYAFEKKSGTIARYVEVSELETQSGSLNLKDQNTKGTFTVGWSEMSNEIGLGNFKAGQEEPGEEDKTKTYKQVETYPIELYVRQNDVHDTFFKFTKKNTMETSTTAADQSKDGFKIRWYRKPSVSSAKLTLSIGATGQQETAPSMQYSGRFIMGQCSYIQSVATIKQEDEGNMVTKHSITKVGDTGPAAVTGANDDPARNPLTDTDWSQKECEGNQGKKYLPGVCKPSLTYTLGLNVKDKERMTKLGYTVTGQTMEWEIPVDCTSTDYPLTGLTKYYTSPSFTSIEWSNIETGASVRVKGKTGGAAFQLDRALVFAGLKKGLLDEKTDVSANLTLDKEWFKLSDKDGKAKGTTKGFVKDKRSTATATTVVATDDNFGATTGVIMSPKYDFDITYKPGVKFHPADFGVNVGDVRTQQGTVGANGKVSKFFGTMILDSIDTASAFAVNLVDPTANAMISDKNDGALQ
jgi:hypothetical protein